MGLILLVVYFAFLATPSFAEAAGWVLIAPPRDKNGDYIRNEMFRLTAHGRRLPHLTTLPNVNSNEWWK